MSTIYDEHNPECIQWPPNWKDPHPQDYTSNTTMLLLISNYLTPAQNSILQYTTRDTTTFSSTLHRIPQYSIVYYNIPQYSTVYYNIPQYSKVHYTGYHNILQYTTRDTTVFYSTLHGIPQYSTVHYTRYHSILQYTTTYHSILQYTTRDTTVFYSTLQTYHSTSP